MDNWYNKQFTTNPDKNDKSLNATALAVLLLRDAPCYWQGHPSLEELERRVPIVARMLGNTEGTFARILIFPHIIDPFCMSHRHYCMYI